MELDLDDEQLAYLADHEVQGEVRLPGAAFVEMALEAANVAFAGRSATIGELRLSSPLILRASEATVLQLVIQAAHAGTNLFRFASRPAKESTASWTEHASGRIGFDRELAMGKSDPSTLQELQKRCAHEVSAAALYDDLRAAGLSYGPAFHGIEQAWKGEGEALSKLVGIDKLTAREGYVVHPSLLEAAFLTSAVVVERGADRPSYVPSTVGALRVLGKGGARWVHVTARTVTKEAIETDIRLFDDKGRVVVEVEALRLLPAARATDRLDEWLFEMTWRASASKVAETARGSWLLLADEQGLAGGLRSWLEARGADVVTVTRAAGFRKQDATHYEIDSLEPESMLRLMKEAFGKTAPKSVVTLFSLDTRATSQRPLDEQVAQRARDLTCTSTLHLTQALAQMGWSDPPRLFVVTRGCQAATGSRDVMFPEQALAWGFGASVAHEMAELQTTLVDVEEETLAEALGSELAGADDENRVALRGSERLVPRLTRHVRAKAAPGALRPLTVGAEEGYTLDALEPARLESLTLRPAVVPMPGPGQVVIRTRASGLSFRDVLIAQGMYPGLGAGRLPMGSECAGVVHAVGEGVRKLGPGDEVVALAPHSVDAYVVASAELVVKKPAHLSFEQAAAIPSVMMTALCALQRGGHLRQGERILIHAATGGVGLAAVQYAKHVGAEIYATAGSEAKRAHLRSLGIAHVYDSRTLSWAEDVERDTGGRGLDVVLNSLGGEALPKGVSVLAPFGRFFELAQRDVYENGALGPHARRNNVTVSAVALDQLVADRPDEARALLEETFRLVEAGVFSPLPVECFPVSRALDAFEHLSRARHIGKVVLTAEENVTVRDSARSEQVQSDKTYLVTGGLGGLGLVVAKRLAKLGAKHLALMGRSAPSESAQVAIGELEASGARVYVVSADVAERPALASALADLARSSPPVAGLVHAAGVLDDATLSNLTAARIGPVLAPKVLGALALDGLLPDLAMRVYFSSVAGVLGSAGQAHFAAANAFLDAFAHHTASRSQRAVSLDWGAWSAVGLASSADRVDHFARQGLAVLSPEEGAELFERTLSTAAVQLAPMPIDIRQWRQANPLLAWMPLLRELVTSSSSARTTQNVGLFDRLRDAPSEAERIAVLEEYMRSTIATVLRSSPDAVSRTAPFKQLGFDSLMTVSLKNMLERDLAIPVSTATLFAYPSVDRLAAFVAAKLQPTTAPSNDPTRIDPTTVQPGKAPHPGTDALPTLDDMLSELSKAGYL